MITIAELPSCKEIVESATDYLEGALSDQDRACLEQHLVLCDGCDAYVAQIRTLAEAARDVVPEVEPVEAAIVDALVGAFRAQRGR